MPDLTLPYQPFALALDRDDHHAYRVRVLNSPSGQANGTFIFPLTADEMSSFRTWRGLGESDLQAVGTRLFRALFAEVVGECWRSSLAMVQQSNGGLRLNLHLTAVPELAAVPWELLYDPTAARHLALSVRTPIVRYLELFQPERPLVTEPPLRVLAVFCDPAGVEESLDVEREWQMLTTGLASLQAEGRLVLERLAPSTLAGLRQRLLEEDVHVLHFVGHGLYDAGRAEGSLVFEGGLDDAGYELVPAERFALFLHNHRALRLVYLNVCESALAGGQAIFAGIAQALVRQELPAAVAMQAEISDEAAVHLSQAFYAAVAAGYPVDAALTHARVALAGAGSPEWPKPVLFSRADDNRLFAAEAQASLDRDKQATKTEGGAFIGGNVSVGGNFVGRDQIVHGYSAEEVERLIDRFLRTQEEPAVEAAHEFEPLHFEPETVLIPAGPFLMGSQPGDGIPAAETPQHEVDLPVYRIGVCPVTNAQYAEFVRQTGCLVDPAMGWPGQFPAVGTANLPVSGVTYGAALAYCAWLSNQTGRSYTLPSEAQWEKAARGVDGRRFPWGNEWQDGRCNLGGDDLTPVDAFPAQGPFGCRDLVGNVRQWTRTIWGESFRQDQRFAYPWRDDGRSDPASDPHLRRVVRGSAYADTQDDCRCAARRSSAPDRAGPAHKRIGFRIVLELGEP